MGGDTVTTVIKKYFRLISCFLMTVLLISATMIIPKSSSSEPEQVLHNGDALREGLAGTVVNCIVQDSGGFLWFGTQNGLYRYNGYSLKSFTFHSDYSNQFVSDFITALAEDNAGSLWIGTLAGELFKLNLQTGERTSFYHNDDDPISLNDNAIRSIYKEQSGKLWIGFQNKGVDCLDPFTGIFTHYENFAGNADTISSNTVNSICQDKSGTLWLGTVGGGLNKFEPQTGQFSRLNRGDLMDNISWLHIDRMDVLWIVSEEGSLYRLDMLTQAIINLLSNAVKFTRKGSIKIDMQYSDDHVLVSIEDTGAGIQPDLLERVFDRFYRVKAAAG